MPHKLIVTIKDNGSRKIEVEGIKGESCREITARVFGTDNTNEEVVTNEFYELEEESNYNYNR